MVYRIVISGDEDGDTYKHLASVLLKYANNAVQIKKIFFVISELWAIADQFQFSVCAPD